MHPTASRAQLETLRQFVSEEPVPPPAQRGGSDVGTIPGAVLVAPEERTKGWRPTLTARAAVRFNARTLSGKRFCTRPAPHRGQNAHSGINTGL